MCLQTPPLTFMLHWYCLGKFYVSESVRKCKYYAYDGEAYFQQELHPTRRGKQYNWVSPLGSYQLLQYVTTYAHYQRLRKCASRRMIAEEALEQIFDRDSVWKWEQSIVLMTSCQMRKKWALSDTHQHWDKHSCHKMVLIPKYTSDNNTISCKYNVV